MSADMEVQHVEKVYIDAPPNKYRIRLATCLAELLGTATLMFIGCMGCIVNIYSSVIVQFAPFSFGMAVAMAIQVFGHISGGHFNPCVTIAAKILNKIDWLSVPLYFISQLIGAFLGYGFIMIVIPEDLTEDLCVTFLHPRIKVYQGLLLEIVLTGLLILFCCAVWDGRLSSQTDSISIRFGLILGGMFIATSQFTGTGINPVRSLAPAVFQNYWTSHWVYWVGPTIGSVIFTYIYKYGFPEK